MPAQVTNYQCPACTGPLHFSSSSGKLECEYCGSAYDVAEIEALYAQKEAKAADAYQKANEAKEQPSSSREEWDTSGLSSDWGSEGDNLTSYSCPSCGAELICETTTAATACPYCGNPTIVPGQFSGALRPDLIIPFQVDKNAAIQALKAHYKGKHFLPKAFTDENHLQKVQGVYVPFWLFDGVAEGEILCKATRSRSYTSGDYRVTETEHFDVQRSGSLPFGKVPVDASSKMSDDYMDSLEPYDYKGLKDFSTAYLPGFLADKYDVSVDDCRSRADERCENTAEQALRSTIDGYDTCATEKKDIRLHRGKVHYALFPVWVLNTQWKGKSFLFTMNGQTGKLVGNLPVSRGKYWATFASIAAAASAVGCALMMALLH